MAEKGLTNYLRFFSRNSQEDPGMVIDSELSSRLLSTVESLVIILNTDGKIVEFNPACERLTGYTKRDVLGRRFDFLIPKDELGNVRDVVEAIISDKLPSNYENHWVTKDGVKRLIAWSNTNLKDEEGRVTHVVASGMDVTEDRLREKRRILMMEIFSTLAQAGTQGELLNRILHVFRDYAGCDAAGMRLRQDDDYPYVHTIGFTDHFVREESMLCSLQHREGEGPPTLECMCGRVIEGDLDPDLAPVTEKGAFFTGNINELAARLAPKNLPFTIRNHCGQAGFRSIALIPVRFQEETVGLVQLNDKNPGKFSEDDIDFLSIAGQSVGAALVRLQSEEAQRKSEKILNALVENARDGFAISSPDGKYVMYNKAMERISGYSHKEVNRHGWFYLVFPNEEERRAAVQKARLLMAGKLDRVESRITHKDGSQVDVAFSISPLDIEGKTYNFTTMIDLTHKYDH